MSKSMEVFVSTQLTYILNGSVAFSGNFDPTDKLTVNVPWITINCAVLQRFIVCYIWKNTLSKIREI